ncbi:sensor histidine kinase [Pseudoalteromonas denitrificans]|uniref:histidine kinase n=1 Tax=Pseudoalteromonas denitrificans DSM 6059 TaxID=1123010 RepID=A0A1I1T6M3_9GAMM|nr:ATP-binding protein [Pseudoalteromonas denitrificans]SFD52768.1 Histidine kinase-, DNA gyrase B-, and HSP90-like ATPase [Pseudoalteromonas denitrificans DSM 6059]
MNKKSSFEKQLTQLSLVASLPLFIFLIFMMVYAEISTPLILLTILISSITIIFCHAKIHQISSYQFRSICNLLDAMIQGDYSLRARSSEGDSALNELVDSVNSLAKRLTKQRIESIESQFLLQTVIKHIDVATIALNSKNKLVFINPAAKKLLQFSSHTTEEVTLKQLEQLNLFKAGESKVMNLTFGQQQGKFNVHMEEFREAGKQHKLLFLTDVSSLLRIEERNAWQSLVRVISHEINNSLAPIASISETLKRLMSRQHNIEVHKENLVDGLTIIAQRTNNLKDFVNSYKQIAQLPEPKKSNIYILELLNKIIPLYQNSHIDIQTKDDMALFIDPVQIEQVLINLIKNAVESIKSTHKEGKIEVSWQVVQDRFQLLIKDQGAGISNPDNLFVPFYTTKKQGSGIGLVLCRQILEVHSGRLSLSNCTDQSGCLATVELPLS